MDYPYDSMKSRKVHRLVASVDMALASQSLHFRLYGMLPKTHPPKGSFCANGTYVGMVGWKRFNIATGLCYIGIGEFTLGGRLGIR